MYDVLDICRYTINYSNKKNYGISNLKLQKILYFIQAYFLLQIHQPCFKENIEAWDFGPVVPEAYHEYKQYGSGDIPTIKSYLQFDSDDIWNVERVVYDDTLIKSDDKKMINSVIDKFADYSATDLVTITHNQAPWKNAYVTYSNNSISNESLRRYFEEG